MPAQRRVRTTAPDHRQHDVAGRPRRRHHREIAPRVPQVAEVHRHRLGPADQRQAGRDGDQREHASSRSGRCGRPDSATAARACARSDPRAGWPPTRAPPRGTRASHEHRHQKEDLSEIEVQPRTAEYSSISRAAVRVGRRRPRPEVRRRRRLRAKCATMASARLAPTTEVSSSRVARRTPATLPKRRQQRLAAGAGRRRGPHPAPTASRASRAPCDGRSRRSGGPRRESAAAAAAPARADPAPAAGRDRG